MTLAASLLGLAALAAPALAVGLNGTTLESSISATTERIRDHRWTIAKTASATALDMFRGDSATVTYTIAATDTGAVDRAFMKGAVTVTNAGGEGTQDLTITVAVSTLGSGATTVATGSVSTAAKPALGPGETFSYPYSVEVPGAATGTDYKATAQITITNHSGSLGSPEGPSPSTTATMTGAFLDTNTAVNVDDTNGQTFAFSGSGTRTYTTSFTCDRDAGAHVNTATIRQTGQSASATVTVRCFALSVQTTANTSLTRTYAWSIAKSADASSVTLEPDGSSAAVGFVVALSSTSTDSAWAVSGQITVTNPAPNPAPLASVSATLPAGAASVTCGGTSVPAGSSLVCTYGRALASAASTTVTATATLTNTPSGTSAFTATANVDFASASVTEIDKTVSVTDSAGGATRSLGTATAGGTGRFTYTQAVGPYAKCGAYTYTNTASFAGASGATGSSSAQVPVTVKCYQLGLSGTSSTGLTRTFVWSIAKAAGAPSLTLEPSASGELPYTVDVTSAPSDSAWAASGTLTVTNPSPVVASLSSLTASAVGTGATLAGCPASVPARGSIGCAWSAGLGSGTSGTLALAAVLVDSSAFTAASYSGSAPVDFGSATITEVDRTVSVKDLFGTNTRDLGTVSAGDSGHFSYKNAVGPYAKCGPYSVKNTASFAAPSGATGSASTTTPVSVKCYDLGASSTATTALTRTYTWTLAKTAAASSLTLKVGETGLLGYTLTLGSSSADGPWTASGTIRVTNPAPVAATLSGVTASAGSTPVVVSCPASLTVPGGGSIECTWTAAFGSGSAATLAATATLANSDAFNGATAQTSATIDFAAAAVSEVDKTATVTDTMGTTTRTFGPATASSSPTTYTYTMPVGPFASCTPTSVKNNATLTTADTHATRTASVTTPVAVTCYQLGVTVDAGTALTRTYSWQIAKTADRGSLTLEEGQALSVTYTVSLTSTSADSSWAARGNITIANGAPTAVTLSNVTASGATVSCPTLTIAGGGSLTCTWTRSLTSASSGSLTVTATVADPAFDSTSYAGSASYDFTSPTVTSVDRTVTVTDTAGGATRTLGTVSAGDAGTFTYATTVGPYATCGQYTFTNTATFTAPSGKSGSASYAIPVNVPCTGCTLTIGYWKTHAGLGPQADMMLGKLPISLGTVGGAKTVTVSTESQAVNILGMAGDASNGINKLYGQLLGAKLNIAAGATSGAVATTISQADTFLATRNASDWSKLSKSQKAAVLSWASTLDQYNTGLIGPGHCSE